MKKYNTQNVFAKIINGAIPSKKIYEDDFVLCFEDVNKAAKVHWLIIPKGEYTCFDDFIANATDQEISYFFKTVRKIAAEHGLDKAGYKLTTNNGEGANQSVFHFHFHLLSGQNLWHL